LFSSNTGFNCTEEEIAHSLALLRKRAWIGLRAKIDEQTADTAILAKLRTHFEERFRYDEQGIPRVWKPDDDIDGVFKKAKDQVNFSCHALVAYTESGCRRWN
jgi:protein SEY1